MVFRRLSLVATASVVLALPLLAGPRLTYSKSFPGSTPAWLEISIERTGAGVYKEDPKEEDPLKFQLAEADAAQIFGLVDKLDRFSHPLESPLKVANMGMKTFRYESGEGSGAGSGEVKFNYSEDLDAKALTDWFERIAESERSLIELERSVRFDKLGAQNAILRIEILRDQKRLVAPEQFLPMLDRVAKNEIFLHIARDRAAALTDSIRAQPK
jgi:hypothetical protein